MTFPKLEVGHKIVIYSAPTYNRGLSKVEEVSVTKVGRLYFQVAKGNF